MNNTANRFQVLAQNSTRRGQYALEFRPHSGVGGRFVSGAFSNTVGHFARQTRMNQITRGLSARAKKARLGYFAIAINFGKKGA